MIGEKYILSSPFTPESSQCVCFLAYTYTLWTFNPNIPGIWKRALYPGGVGGGALSATLNKSAGRGGPPPTFLIFFLQKVEKSIDRKSQKKSAQSEKRC